MQKFICAYTKNDGKTGTLKIEASSIVDAAQQLERFVAAMYKKYNTPFDAASITSVHILVAPKRGRSKKNK